MPYIDDKFENSELKKEIINGVGNQQKSSYRNGDNELHVPGENLIIIPENKLGELGYGVSKPPGKPSKIFWKRGSETLVGRRHNGSYYLNKSDTIKVRNEFARLHRRAKFENGVRFFNEKDRDFSNLIRYFPSMTNVAERACSSFGPALNLFLWRRCYSPVYYVYLVHRLVRGDSHLRKYSERISADILKPRRVSRIEKDFREQCQSRTSVSLPAAPVAIELRTTAEPVATQPVVPSSVEPSSQEGEHIATVHDESEVDNPKFSWKDAIEKMENFDFNSLFEAHQRLKSQVEAFEREFEKLQMKREKRRAEKKGSRKALRVAETIAENVYPARHVCSSLPISHYFHHRPHDINCSTCNRAKMIAPANLKTPVEEESTSSSKVYVYADLIGKTFPKSSRGNVQGLCIGNSLGDVYISALKSKAGPEIVKGFRRFFELTHTSPSNCVVKVDQLGVKILRETFTGMVINEGIANHPGSHAKAESVVKDCLYGLRSLLDAAGGPSHTWDHAANVYSFNLSLDMHNRRLGRYKGFQFIFGETSYIKLDRAVYTPPVTSPSGTLCQFLSYNLDSNHGLIVEYFDENRKERRKTEVSSEEFQKGLPSERPVFGYRKVPGEDPLVSMMEDMLDPSRPVEQPVVQSEEEDEEVVKRKKSRRKRGRPRVNMINDSSEISSSDSDSSVSSDEIDSEISRLANETDSLYSQMQFSHSDLADCFDISLDLGAADDVSLPKNSSPSGIRNVSVGESCRLIRGTCDNQNLRVCLVKTLRPREVQNYPNLDWRKASHKEKDKMFTKFKVLNPACAESSSLPVGADIIRLFPVFTIKNFETISMQVPSVRLVGGGNNILKKGTGRASKVTGRQDVIETSSPESVRCVLGVGKLRQLKCKQEDADGAYLQTPRNVQRRPQGLFARLPREFWPEGSAAFNMKDPVFPVDGNLYGMPEAGFDFQTFSRTNLQDQGYSCYKDIDTSIYDFVEKEFREHYENLPEEDIDWSTVPGGLDATPGILSQYVDDFVNLYKPGSNAENALNDSLKLKPDEDHSLKRLLGQDWENVYEFEKDGFSVFCANQTKYIEQLILTVNEISSKLGYRAIKDQSTPALDKDHAFGEIDEKPGLFAPHAKSLVQSILFIARCTRLDCLFAVVRLSRFFTKWTLRQDQWLLRLMGYLQRTKDYKLWFIVNPKDLDEKTLCFDNFVDADLAGDFTTRRSTSGWVGLLNGQSGTCIPIGAHAKRQGQVGLSTPESEVLATVVGAKRSIRHHMLLCRMLKYSVKHRYLGDNSPSGHILAAGLSAQLAYMKRTQGVSLAWAHDNCSQFFEHVGSDENTADIMNKPLDSVKFAKHRASMNIGARPEDVSTHIRRIVQLRKTSLKVRD